MIRCIQRLLQPELFCSPCCPNLGGVLGINAGIGNIGVGVCQILFPVLAAVPILGMAPISEDAQSPFGGQVTESARARSYDSS